MKLIIDIDERAYKGCVKLKNNDDMGVLGFHLINATANGIPLEEITAKIQEKADSLPYRQNAITDGMIDGLEEAIEIIDEHIKENKQ